MCRSCSIISMKNIQRIDIQAENREEILPGFSEDFPYIASHVELDRYPQPVAGWHWHSALELFYMEKGSLQCSTPGGTHSFPAGSGTLINSGVLHTSRWNPAAGENILLVHLFEPELISGRANSRVHQKYLRPLLDSGIEILPIHPDSPKNIELLARIRAAFELSEEDFGYELRIRQLLSDVWMDLLALAGEQPAQPGRRSGEQIKQMMHHVHAHYGEHISVDDLAAAAHLSRRACFRLFQSCLHMTPVEYIQSYRLQIACQLLAEGERSITEIAYLCGMGSSSYFSRLFREEKGCTPAEYRRHWHDQNK